MRIETQEDSERMKKDRLRERAVSIAAMAIGTALLDLILENPLDFLFNNSP